MKAANDSGTKVKSLMHPGVKTVSPESTLQEAAEQMHQLDCGVLPVGDEERPVGIITDRDIVIRAVAKGKDVNVERVRDYMTSLVYSVREEETLEQAADKMWEYQVSRLLVEGENGKICGIITFGSIMRKNDRKEEIASVAEHAFKGAATG